MSMFMMRDATGVPGRATGRTSYPEREVASFEQLYYPATSFYVHCIAKGELGWIAGGKSCPPPSGFWYAGDFVLISMIYFFLGGNRGIRGYWDILLCHKLYNGGEVHPLEAAYCGYP